MFSNFLPGCAGFTQARRSSSAPEAAAVSGCCRRARRQQIRVRRRAVGRHAAADGLQNRNLDCTGNDQWHVHVDEAAAIRNPA